MSKDEFVNALRENGYKVDYNGSLPTVSTDKSYKEIVKFARSLDYHYSFAVKKADGSEL